ncbi:uncharacterized protein LOC112596286 [Melanaphis sacchari]|uniref:uncharacterized protein LOC112596286 n=1 Tax=Melanaphis sacchari TaxID=742174 RepID=UPI000DC153C9|nr:uncharacterized protein LOC112596286 [Melanaphis sacchari]
MMELLNKVIENDPVFCPNGCGHSYIVQCLNHSLEKYQMFCSNSCGRSYIPTGKHRKYNLKHHLNDACGINLQFDCNFYEKQLKSK